MLFSNYVYGVICYYCFWPNKISTWSTKNSHLLGVCFINILSPSGLWLAAFRNSKIFMAWILLSWLTLAHPFFWFGDFFSSRISWHLYLHRYFSTSFKNCLKHLSVTSISNALFKTALNTAVFSLKRDKSTMIIIMLCLIEGISGLQQAFKISKILALRLQHLRYFLLYPTFTYLPIRGWQREA